MASEVTRRDGLRHANSQSLFFEFHDLGRAATVLIIGSLKPVFSLFVHNMLEIKSSTRLQVWRSQSRMKCRPSILSILTIGADGHEE